MPEAELYLLCPLTRRAKLVFRGIFGAFRGTSEFVFIYSTISRGTPDDVLRNPGRETLIQMSHKFGAKGELGYLEKYAKM
jgi:hypothetical protein